MLAGWRYYRKIIVTNSSSTALTNYQIKVSLDNTNFDFSKAKSDGSDIRFTDDDGTTLLKYWIEAYDSSGETATVWVKVPSIPASSTKTIYLYYGNASATSESNGDDVFEFFDDFEGTALDTNKWTEINSGGSYSIENSILTVTGGSSAWEGIGAKTQFGYPRVFELLAKISEAYEENLSVDDRSATGSAIGSDIDRLVWGYRTSKFWETQREGTGTIDDRSTDLSDAFHRLKAYWTHDEVDFYNNGVLQHSITTNIPLDNIGYFFEAYSTDGIAYVDWVFVREYADTEPTNSVGSERAVSNAIMFGMNF